MSKALTPNSYRFWLFNDTLMIYNPINRVLPSTRPRSMTPPNNAPVICNSFKGYLEWNWYSLNRFVTMQAYNSFSWRLPKFFH